MIGAGAAPVEVFDMLLEALDPGGKFVLSYNDHTLEDPVFYARIKTPFLKGMRSSCQKNTVIICQVGT